MTKQEEIKEGIKEIIIRKEFVAEVTQHMGTTLSYDKMVDELMEYLHSQGVVLKVDRELPVMPPATDEELKARFSGKCQFIRQGEYFNTWFCGLTGETSRTMRFCEKWNGGSCSPEEGILRFRRGYVAVEPLIKED